ncbi:MAG TPA: hypothetical protein GX513_12450 [Firmicutes bacterium]|nr:hypothetical protein [Bacillota bacterium]
MLVSAVVSHTDWAYNFGNWGEVGVKTIIDKCCVAGIQRVYWRAFSGGLANYLSKYEDVYHGTDADEAKGRLDLSGLLRAKPGHWGMPQERGFVMDYREWDPLAVAVTYGHQRGIQVYAWYTLNEEDHGWVGMLSKFARENPQWCWVDRGGRKRWTNMSFAYDEVRRHKLRVMTELASYGVDGILLDFIRRAGKFRLSGDRMVDLPPFTDERGTFACGYEEPSVQEFSATYGVAPHDIPNDDPRWVHHRAGYYTRFMREVSEWRRDGKLPTVQALVFPPYVLDEQGHAYAFGDGLQFSAVTPPPVRENNLYSLCLDLKSWVAEGLVDGITVMHSAEYTTEAWRCNPHAIVAEIREMESQVARGCRLASGVYCYGTTTSHLRECFVAAKQARVEEVTLFETTPLQQAGSTLAGMWATVRELGHERWTPGGSE